MESVNMKDITNKIIDGLVSNYNYPMVENITIFTDDSSGFLQYTIKLVLRDSFEFVFDNGCISNIVEFQCFDLDDYNIELVIQKFFKDLYKARLKDLYLYRRKEDRTQEEFGKNIDYMSDKLFSKSYNELTKQENSIVFGYSSLFKYNNSKEIIDDLKEFINREGRFPFKKEWLYKVLEYAKQVSFISDEELREIYNYASSHYFDKLCGFIEQEKRWPYQSEFEYSRCWSEVCYNYSKGLYTDEQIIKLDVLYSRYNNDKDSLGERLVNSFISGLGYKIEKQKTFEDLVYKQKLRFDTCIENDGKLLLIEYDGPQHFKAIDYFGGQKTLAETQTRDRIKDEYCQKNNIPLLRISYKQLKNMEELVKEFIEKNFDKQISVK